MFSEDFCISDKYNLNTLEKVSTIEMLPRRFTSLVDPQYLPSLSDTQKTKLNLFYNFVQRNTTDPNHDYDHQLYIEHVDGEIISFLAKRMLRYTTIKHHHLWSIFFNEIELPELNDCKGRIDKMTDETDESATYFSGIKYNPDMSLNSIHVNDDMYNLAGYEDNQVLNKINEMVKLDPQNTKCTMAISPNTNDIVAHVVWRYPETYTNNGFGRGLFKREEYTRTIVLQNINMLYSNGLITQEQGDFILSTCAGKSFFNAEFHVSDTSEVKDVFIQHYRIDKFKDLTTL